MGHRDRMTEADLVRDIRDSEAWRCLVRRQESLHVSYEQSICSSGIADIVVSAIDRQALTRRRCGGIAEPVTDRLSIAVLGAMPRNVPIGVPRIRERLGWGEAAQLSRALESLRERRVVICERPGIYRKAKFYGSVVTRCVAVEVKLSDWRQGIAQAVNYRLFADEVYVLLPERRAAAPTRNEHHFRETGVGLALWDGSALRVLVAAAVRPPASLFAHAVASEAVLADMVGA